MGNVQSKRHGSLPVAYVTSTSVAQNRRHAPQADAASEFGETSTVNGINGLADLDDASSRQTPARASSNRQLMRADSQELGPNSASGDLATAIGFLLSQWQTADSYDEFTSEGDMDDGHGIEGEAYTKPGTALVTEEIARYEAFGLLPLCVKDLDSLTTISLCSRKIQFLGRCIGVLTSITCLQLCCNNLTSLPNEIGLLHNLLVLDVSQNQIATLPTTIGRLSKLTELHADQNVIEQLPASLGSCKRLTVISISKNYLRQLPAELGRLSKLKTLVISHNPIEYLPAEVGRLKSLNKLVITSCPLKRAMKYETSRSPPSLAELAARTIIRLGLPFDACPNPAIIRYLRSANACSHCGGPFFETYWRRLRLLETSEMRVPLEYRLCTPHWNSEAERVSMMFCPLPNTAPNPVHPAPSTSRSAKSSPRISRKFTKTINRTLSSTFSSSSESLSSSRRAPITTDGSNTDQDASNAVSPNLLRRTTSTLFKRFSEIAA